MRRVVDLRAPAVDLPDGVCAVPVARLRVWVVPVAVGAVVSVRATPHRVVMGGSGGAYQVHRVDRVGRALGFLHRAVPGATRAGPTRPRASRGSRPSGNPPNLLIRTETPMTEPIDHATLPSASGADPSLDPLAAFGERAGQALRAFTDLSAADVFSPPVHAGERVVVTAATITRRGGFGFGGGAGSDAASATQPLGGGGGGGGRGEARPTAVIEIAPAGVSVQPIVDPTRIALATLGTMVGLALLHRLRHHR